MEPPWKNVKKRSPLCPRLRRQGLIEATSVLCGLTFCLDQHIHAPCVWNIAGSIRLYNWSMYLSSFLPSGDQTTMWFV